MCENARRCEECNHKHRIIKLVHMEYQGEYRGIWLCEECHKKLEEMAKERERIFNEAYEENGKVKQRR